MASQKDQTKIKLSNPKMGPYRTLEGMAISAKQPKKKKLKNRKTGLYRNLQGKTI
jgi:hypothetical protein